MRQRSSFLLASELGCGLLLGSRGSQLGALEELELLLEDFVLVDLVVQLVDPLLQISRVASLERDLEDDLFEATQRKVNSQSFGDLKEVILLCESAIRKGLDEQNQNFAKQLIASTRFERASRICEEIFDRYPPSDNWPTLSQLARVDLEGNFFL